MDDGELNGTERAIFGDLGAADVVALLDDFVRAHLGSAPATVLFRSGRIDAVWALRLDDGRDVVVKAHRAPVDLTARGATTAAQAHLVDAGFPCPEPLTGPVAAAGLVLSAETLMAEGEQPDGSDPGTRALLAAGLAEHVRLLRQRPDLTSGVGAGPAWCRYADGAWPRPHDTIFDFRRTPDGFEWLDAFADRAAAQVRASRDDAEVVVGHADWCVGNLRTHDGRLVATFDWDLVADTEAVVAGLSAGGFGASPATGAELPSPEQARAFLADYASARGRRFDDRERRAAAGATSFVVAYQARCNLGLLEGEVRPGSALDLAARRHADYLDPS